MPNSEFPDYYAVLGIQEDAEDDAIKSAYRGKSRSNHPDRGGDSSLMQEIGTAKALLIDPGKRRRYNKLYAVKDKPGFDSDKAKAVVQRLLISNLDDSNDSRIITNAVNEILAQVQSAQQNPSVEEFDPQRDFNTTTGRGNFGPSVQSNARPAQQDQTTPTNYNVGDLAYDPKSGTFKPTGRQPSPVAEKAPNGKKPMVNMFKGSEKNGKEGTRLALIKPRKYLLKNKNQTRSKN